MARGLNKVILIGNVGKDVDLKTFDNGTKIVTLTLATSENWKDKKTGEQQERTEWHRAVLFNRLAEIASNYLQKGSKVYIEGSLRTRKWLDKEGVEHYTTEIMGNEILMLDSSKRNEYSKENSEFLDSSNEVNDFDDLPF